jgi:hypothetical protein
VDWIARTNRTAQLHLLRLIDCGLPEYACSFTSSIAASNSPRLPKLVAAANSMKSTRFSGLPSFDSSFGKHRSRLYPQKFALELSLSKTTPAPDWAPLPSPPMSGSPSPENPPEQPQVAGRRRKRSSTPPIDTTGATAAASQTPTEQDPSRRRTTQQTEAPELATTAVAVTAPGYPSSYLPAQSFGYSPSGPSIISSAPTTLETQLGSGDVAPRTSRKTKAHVASACVNCKKKHLRCDNARPCRRCVQSGKEVSCQN